MLPRTYYIQKATNTSFSRPKFDFRCSILKEENSSFEISLELSILIFSVFLLLSRPKCPLHIFLLVLPKKLVNDF